MPIVVMANKVDANQSVCMELKVCAKWEDMKEEIKATPTKEQKLKKCKNVKKYA